MGKRGMSGAKHRRAGGGSRARGRRGKVKKFHQGKPDRRFFKKAA